MNNVIIFYTVRAVCRVSKTVKRLRPSELIGHMPTAAKMPATYSHNGFLFILLLGPATTS